MAKIKYRATVNHLTIAKHKLSRAGQDLERLSQIKRRVLEIEKLAPSVALSKELDDLAAEIETMRQRTGKI